MHPLQGGWTPLHFAALNTDKAAAELLVKLGADVNAADKCGSTPLHVVLASLENSHSALELSKEDWIRWPIQFLPTKSARVIPLIRWLVSNGGNMYTENSKGHTPLSLIQDPAVKHELMFLTRRPLLLVLEAICVANDLKNTDSIQRVATNIDLRRYVLGWL